MSVNAVYTSYVICFWCCYIIPWFMKLIILLPWKEGSIFMVTLLWFPFLRSPFNYLICYVLARSDSWERILLTNLWLPKLLFRSMWTRELTSTRNLEHTCGQRPKKKKLQHANFGLSFCWCLFMSSCLKTLLMLIFTIHMFSNGLRAIVILFEITMPYI